MWCLDLNNKSIMNDMNVRAQTMVGWKQFCREVCMELCVRESEELGGPGVIVKVDESKFGKRKYNRRKRVDGI